MKSTGIIRRIDDLGRVCIPKEIRHELHIKEGDALECYTSHEGEVVFKKYSAMKCMTDFASSLCESALNAWGLIAVVTDRSSVIAAPHKAKSELVGMYISNQLADLIGRRRDYQYDGDFAVFADEAEKYFVTAAVPIIAQGEILGSVLILGDQDQKDGNDAKYMLAKTIAPFLGKQMEV